MGNLHQMRKALCNLVYKIQVIACTALAVDSLPIELTNRISGMCKKRKPTVRGNWLDPAATSSKGSSVGSSNGFSDGTEKHQVIKYSTTDVQSLMFSLLSRPGTTFMANITEALVLMSFIQEPTVSFLVV